MTTRDQLSTIVDRSSELQLHGRPMSTRNRYQIEEPTTGRRLTDAPDCSADEII